MFDFIQVPKDWDVVNVWKESNPNKIGEALCHWSFVGRNGERGCYSTFKLPDFFKPLISGELFDKANSLCYPDEDIKLNCFIYDQPEVKDEHFYIEPMILVVAWRWDGDGSLYFRLIGKEKDIEVINNDCKCSYDWKFVEETNG